MARAVSQLDTPLSHANCMAQRIQCLEELLYDLFGLFIFIGHSLLVQVRYDLSPAMSVHPVILLLVDA